MKATTQLRADMQDAYHRYQQSNLSQKAFCQAEGISKGKFTYWCRQFESQSISARNTLTTSPAKPKSDTSTQQPGFTPISVPATAALTPLLAVELTGKGRIEFYTGVEASFLKELLS